MNEDKNTLPLDFIQRLEEIIPPNYIGNVLSSFSQTPVLSIRVNKLAGSIEEVTNALTKNLIEYVHVPWYDSALVLPDSGTAAVMSLPEYKDGKIYIQSLSSMIPAIVLSPKETESVLDIAAAPGSKTTQIADLMSNKGTIIANDISRSRMYKLKENLKNFHVTNTSLTYIHGERIWMKYPELFDKTLVDVPCSMEGRFNTADPDTFKDWSTKKVKELSHRQKYLLRSAISATRIGGTIIYSTCTISPEENEEVIDWILEKEKGKIIVEKIELNDIPFMPGLSVWRSKQYDPQVENALRIIPGKEYEGFFIAKIKKIEQTTDMAKYL